MMTNPIKEKLTTDIQKAREEGKFRTERIREIVQAAVSEAITEFKGGSEEIRSIVKDAVSAVAVNLQEKGKESKDEITASIEGVIEGLSRAKREAIAKNQATMKQLQDQIDIDEQELETQIDGALTDIEVAGRETPTNVRSTIESVVTSLKDTEEVTLMKKRYAQLQAQLSILQANLATRYGERFEDVNRHLDTAKDWYTKARPQAEVTAEQIKQKGTEFEQKLGEAGTALARQERRTRQLLKELLHSATDLFHEKQEK
jgi:hypothetical protein